MKEKIKFLKIRDVISPSRTNEYDAGIDFYVPIFDEKFIEDYSLKNLNGMSGIYSHSNGKSVFTRIIINPGERALIPSGIKCQMAKPGRALIASNKSGVASKTGLIFGAQVIDYEYQGEIHINVINTSNEVVEVLENQKLIQFLETPIFNSEIEISEDQENFYKKETTRGAKGFGESDKKQEQLNS